MPRQPSPGRVASFLAALWPWLTTRVVVLGALALAHYLTNHLHPPSAVAVRVHEGLLGWDAGYYRDIALKGYGALPRPALRFFPLLPLATRGLHDLTRLPIDYALLGITNACALGAAFLMHRLVRRETGDDRLADLSAWVLALAPSSFVLVMGYSESLLILLAVAAFLAMRSGRWWWAALWSALAGLARPLGILLAVPLAIEALRSTTGSAARGPRRLAPLLSPAAPVAGTAVYLGWVAWRFGDFWLPVRIQERGNLRGHFADPLVTAVHDARDLAHGHIGTGLHVPWLVVFLGLLLVAFRHWPVSYGAFAAAMLALAVSSSNFDSLERYALSAFPLVLAAAGLIVDERRERVVLPLLGALLAGYSLLAFMNALVP